MASSKAVLAVAAALWACDRSVAAPSASDAPVLTISATNPAFGARQLDVREGGKGRCAVFGQERDVAVDPAKVEAFLKLARTKKACALAPVPRKGLANGTTLTFHAAGLECRIDRTDDAWRKDAAPLFEAATTLLRDTCPDPPPPPP